MVGVDVMAGVACTESKQDGNHDSRQFVPLAIMPHNGDTWSETNNCLPTCCRVVDEVPICERGRPTMYRINCAAELACSANRRSHPSMSSSRRYWL
jgi:hypothetical protein